MISAWCGDTLILPYSVPIGMLDIALIKAEAKLLGKEGDTDIPPGLPTAFEYSYMAMADGKGFFLTAAAPVTAVQLPGIYGTQVMLTLTNGHIARGPILYARLKRPVVGV